MRVKKEGQIQMALALEVENVKCVCGVYVYLYVCMCMHTCQFILRKVERLLNSHHCPSQVLFNVFFQNYLVTVFFPHFCELLSVKDENYTLSFSPRSNY